MANLFNLNIKDVVKGLVTAVLASVLVFVYQTITNNTAINWNQILQVALASGIGYIVKNYFTDENGKLLGKI